MRSLWFSAGSVVAGVMLSDADDWQPPALFVLLLVVAVVSEAFRLETKRIHISAAFLAIVLAMALLGPTPAALLGVVAMASTASTGGSPWRSRLVNVSTYAVFPLVGGVVFAALDGPQLLDDAAAGLHPARVRAVPGHELR